MLLLLVDDLMAASRIETTARHLGYGILHARTTDEFWRGISAGPALVLLGTHHTRLPWEVLLRQLKGWPDPPPVLAFGSHMDAGTRARARRAGVARWVANSRLAESLPRLIAEVGRGEASRPGALLSLATTEN